MAASGEPLTWQEVQNVLAAAHVLFGCTPAVAEGRAREDFHGVLMRVPHEGCQNPSSLCRRLRERTEICPSRMRAWIAAAIGTAAGDSSLLSSSTLFRLQDDVLLDLTSVEALARRTRRSWSAPLAGGLQQAARRAINAALERKATLCQSRRPRRAGHSGAPDLDRVSSWLTNHPKVHLLEHAAFVHERIDAICEVLDRSLDRGSISSLAALAPTAAPHLMVLEMSETLRRLGEAVAYPAHEARSRGDASIATWSLTEIVGAHLYNDGHLQRLRLDVLSDDVRRRLHDEAHPAEHLSGTASSPPPSPTHRRLLLARASFERLAGLSAQQQGEDVHVVLRHIAHAQAHARAASHETMLMRLTSDESLVRRAHGQTPQALATLNKGISLARQQRNHRMRFVLHREAAYTCAEHGASLLALEHATMAHETLDIIDDLCEIHLKGRARPGWYQPSFRVELKKLHADLEAAGITAEALQASLPPPPGAPARRGRAGTRGATN